MTIGYVNGARVIFNEKDHTIRIYGTNVMLIGARTKEQAIEQAKRNLKSFKENR